MALAVLLVFLPVARAAQSKLSGPVYEVGVPISRTPSKIGLSVSYGADAAKLDATNINSAGALFAVESLANWEVTVSYDAAECKIYCGFRLKRDSLGRTPIASFLTPPVAIIRVYSDSESKPTVFVVDPAGLSVPAAASRLPDGYDRVSLPGRKLFAVSPAPQGQSQPLAVPRALRFIPAIGAAAAQVAALPLRI